MKKRQILLLSTHCTKGTASAYFGMKKTNKMLLLIAVLILTTILWGCRNPKSFSHVTEGDQTELSDSLDDGYERTRIGDYIYEMYTGVSCPGSVVLRDTLGRIVAESGFDGNGGASYISYFHDNLGNVANIYWGESYGTDSLDAKQEVQFLTEGCKNDKNAIVFSFERDHNGKIIKICSLKSNDSINCPKNGEVTYNIIKWSGCTTNASELYEGGYLNIEFLVKSPKDNYGNWEETKYLGYHKTQYWKYENNKPAKAEAISLVNGKILEKVQCSSSGDTLTMFSENLKDTLCENRVFIDNQLLSYSQKSRWGTILESRSYEVTTSGEVICHCEQYDYTTKAMKSLQPYKVEQKEVDLMECFKTIFINL